MINPRPSASVRSIVPFANIKYQMIRSDGYRNKRKQTANTEGSVEESAKKVVKKEDRTLAARTAGLGQHPSQHALAVRCAAVLDEAMEKDMEKGLVIHTPTAVRSAPCMRSCDKEDSSARVAGVRPSMTATSSGPWMPASVIFTPIGQLTSG